MADEPDTAAQDKLRAASREIEQAFAVVFGHPERRSTEQKIVWRHLCGSGFEERPIILKGSTRGIDPLQVLADAANHDLIVIIKNLVARGWTPDNPANQPKPQAVRES